MNNNITYLTWNVITHPYLTFNSSLTQLPWIRKWTISSPLPLLETSLRWAITFGGKLNPIKWQGPADIGQLSVGDYSDWSLLREEIQTHLILKMAPSHYLNSWWSTASTKMNSSAIWSKKNPAIKFIGKSAKWKCVQASVCHCNTLLAEF